MSSAQTLPHWQLTSIFSDLEGADYLRAVSHLETQLRSLEQMMNEQAIRSGPALQITRDQQAIFEDLLTNYNQVTENLLTLLAYLTGFTSTDAFNDQAKAEASKLRALASRYSTIEKRLAAWLGRLNLSDLIASSRLAKAHLFGLEKFQARALHLMSDDAEALASQLDRTGGSAWSRLHSDLVSKTSIQVNIVGQSKTEFTVSQLKHLQSHENRAVRKQAYQAEIELLSQHEVSFAAAMNSIKGQMNDLTRERGWSSVLEQSVFQNNISMASLEAMQAACRDSFPVFRRYMKAKARFLGQEALAWYDLLAPVSAGKSESYPWDAAKAFIERTFRTYSHELADYAKHSFTENWLDVPPRKGKRNGAFCIGIPARQESRIMLNYGDSLDDVFTLAHELGHGYHNAQMYKHKRSSLQRSTPMTLAETASIFCETIVVNAMLDKAVDEERLALLEQDLLGANQLVVDIYSRFIFEQTVCDKRRERELSTGEFKGIMLDAQAQTYGDALNETERHSLMWAQKGHYYSTARSFYNYPYTFGYLFGLGLYSTYQANPEGFQERYNNLLASTGMADAKTLAGSFGIDIETTAFWQSSLSIAEKRVTEYERLVEKFKI